MIGKTFRTIRDKISNPVTYIIESQRDYFDSFEWPRRETSNMVKVVDRAGRLGIAMRLSCNQTIVVHERYTDNDIIVCAIGMRWKERTFEEMTDEELDTLEDIYHLFPAAMDNETLGRLECLVKGETVEVPIETWSDDEAGRLTPFKLAEEVS